MTKLSDLIGRTGRMLGRNSPAILTGVGVAGVLSVAFLTGKATFAAADLLAETKYKTEVIELSPKEKFAIVWKLYIPPAGAAVATIAAIIFSNRIDARRAAAIATAYTLSEKAWTEYRDKIVETLGKNKEEKARADIAQDLVTKNPPTNQTIIFGEGDSLCMDKWTGRYIRSTMERVKTAMVDTNYKIYREDWASLTSFYDKLGMEPTQESDNIGWDKDNPCELSFDFASDPEGRPVMVFSFRAIPFHY